VKEYLEKLETKLSKSKSNALPTTLNLKKYSLPYLFMEASFFPNECKALKQYLLNTHTHIVKHLSRSVESRRLLNLNLEKFVAADY
jgi:hypothetical protein